MGTMDLMALSIFFAAFIVCSLLVFFISFYGTKEVTFEDNLKASHGVKKSSKGQDTKKKAKKSSKGPGTSEIKPVVEEPKRPETPIEAPQEPEPEIVPEPEEEKPMPPPVVEEVVQQSSAEATPKKSKKKKNKINIEEVDAAVEEPAPRVIETVEVPEPVQVVESVQKKPQVQQQQQ